MKGTSQRSLGGTDVRASAPFTFENVASIFVIDSCEKSQRSAESCGFSPGAPDSSNPPTIKES